MCAHWVRCPRLHSAGVSSYCTASSEREGLSYDRIGDAINGDSYWSLYEEDAYYTYYGHVLAMVHYLKRVTPMIVRPKRGQWVQARSCPSGRQGRCQTAVLRRLR